MFMFIRLTITNQIHCPVMVIDQQLVITLSRLETGLYHHAMVTFQLEKLEPRHKTGVTNTKYGLRQPTLTHSDCLGHELSSPENDNSLCHLSR